ncbi:MAG: FprA family A-type flavoprotein [Sedimentisphaerales bacterium]
MESAIPVSDSIYWVGVNDRQTFLFEAIWPLPRGVCYNSYLIVDKKVALLDTVKEILLPCYLAKLKKVLGPKKQIDCLIVHHLEPDHSGSIPVLLEIFPGMKIIGNKKTAEFLKRLYNIKHNVQIVQDGDELELGRRKLKFFLTPMVHWPESMVSYEPAEKILFSSDAFGGFGTLDGGIFDDTVDISYFEDEILRYFSNIVGKYASMVQKAITKLKDLEVKIVAPAHGPVWRKQPTRIIQLYDKWSRHEAEKGVVVAYASMYGHTEKMAEAVTQGLSEQGLRAVRVHNVSRSHVSYIIRDAWRYKGLILGSPTYDAKVFPPMDSLLSLLNIKMIRKRIVGVFGSYGWAGGAVKAMTQFVKENSLELVEPVIGAQFAANPEELEQCRELGRNIAKHINNSLKP